MKFLVTLHGTRGMVTLSIIDRGVVRGVAAGWCAGGRAADRARGTTCGLWRGKGWRKHVITWLVLLAAAVVAVRCARGGAGHRADGRSGGFVTLCRRNKESI